MHDLQIKLTCQLGQSLLDRYIKLAVFTKMFCLKDINLKRPRSKLSSPAIYSALETHLVPPILNDCHVVAFRGIFSGTPQDVTLQIAARRRQIELKLQESSEVRYLFRYIVLFFFSEGKRQGLRGRYSGINF